MKGLVGIKCSPIFARKKVMEKYFLSVDAEPIYKERSVLIEEFIPKEPVVEDLKVLPRLVYKNCLVVYNQETKELHVYKDEDWVNDPFICLNLEPLSKRYPFYAEESKEDISSEELEKEVEKIIENKSILPDDWPISVDFNFFGIKESDDKVRRAFGSNVMPTKYWGVDCVNVPKFSLFDMEATKKRLDEILPPPTKTECPDLFWVKSCQCPDKRLYMEQYEGRKYPFIHTTDVGEDVLLIPDENNYFYLYFNFKHEQRFDEKRDGTMVDKDCRPFFKLSPTLIEYYGEYPEEFKSSRLKRLLSDDYIAIWNGSEFDVYPKSFVWKKSDYMPATWIPNQDWVTNIYKRKK